MLIIYIVLTIVLLAAFAIEKKLDKKPQDKKPDRQYIKPPTSQELQRYTEYKNMNSFLYSSATYEYYIRNHYGEAEAKYLAKRDWLRKQEKFIEDNFESPQRFREVCAYLERE